MSRERLDSVVVGMRIIFDARRLVADLGGVAMTAVLLEKSRASIYTMLNSGKFTTLHLEAIKNRFPLLDLNKYFVMVRNGPDFEAIRRGHRSTGKRVVDFPNIVKDQKAPRRVAGVPDETT